MPVKVAGKTSATDATYAYGYGIRISDGHLMVMDSVYNNAKVVAVHAPGQWLCAEVVEDQE